MKLSASIFAAIVGFCASLGAFAADGTPAIKTNITQKSCLFLLTPRDAKYKKSAQASHRNHQAILANAEKFDFFRVQGFSSIWNSDLQHATIEYLKLENAAFFVTQDFLIFKEQRANAITSFALVLNRLSFGGLNSNLSLDMKHLRDAMFEYTKNEELALYVSSTFKNLAKRRLQNLLRFERELQDIGTYLVPTKDQAALDFLELRNLWFEYVKTEIAIYSQFP